MYRFLPLLFAFALMSHAVPVVSSYSSAPVLAGKAGGDKYRLPHKLKHDKGDKHADKSAQLA